MKSLSLVCFCLILLSTIAPAQSNPVPLINNPLVPSAVAPGGTGFTLTVNGTGFVSGSVANWSGTALATTFVSSSQLTAIVPAANVANASTASVTVVNPVPGGGVSNVAYFAVATPSVQPAYIESDFTSDTGDQSVAGDFNNDGKLDLAALSTGQIDVHLGNGDGTFQQGSSFAESDAVFLAAGDFNRDGDLDLVTANSNGTISIFLGKGDGTFEAAIDTPTGSKSNSVAMGDFNGDGNLDLAVTNDTASGGVSILLGNGNGTFVPQTVYQAGNTPTSIAAGDFNRDGKLDLAVADGSSSQGGISILQGVGDGTFQAGSFIKLGGPLSVATADLNADGLLDLMVGASRKSVLVYLGNGDGTFSGKGGFSTGSTQPYNLAAADLNEDGILDLACAYNTNSFVVLPGKGDGSFRPLLTFEAGGTVWVAPGDFNNDGLLDLGGGFGVLLQTTAAISASSLNFKKQDVGMVSAPQKVTLYNYSSSVLPITSITISSPFIQRNSCGGVVAPGSGCKINVFFAPHRNGFFKGTLTLTDGAVGSPQTVSLSGSGVAPSVTLSPTSLTFGAQQVGTTSPPQNVTITNQGQGGLNFTSIVASGDFAEINSCGPTLMPGQECTIIVTFTPTTTGTRTGAITITDNAPDSPQSVPLTGTGT
jgi:hypothetical protein